jgi:ABC-type polysaccharide/polyol phosphate export permease
MAVFIDSFRQLLYHGHLPELVNLVYLVVSAILSFVAGWAIFVKLSHRLAEEV